MLTIGSLFSGIGGLELGLERAGIGPVLWQVEQGQPQHAWEPPRTVPVRARGDRARLKALGNSAVPQCAYVVGMRIRQRLELPC